MMSCAASVLTPSVPLPLPVPGVVSQSAAGRVPAIPSLAQQEFASLEAWLSAPSTLHLPLHQVERQQEQKGWELQRLLLEAHIRQRGRGDVGPGLCVFPEGKEPTVYSHRRLHPRVL